MRHRNAGRAPRARAVAAGMLLIILAPALGAVPSPSAAAHAQSMSMFAPPPFAVGDVVRYADAGGDPRLVLEVGPPTQVVDKTGRQVDVLPIRASGDTTYLSPRTMTVETLLQLCVVGTTGPDGRCSTPFQRYSWGAQGTPGPLGAAYLQGRAFRVGDSWTVEGECAACRSSPPRVTIEAPYADSPAGTAYVARIQADYPIMSLNHFRGLVHMGTAHPYPLRADASLIGTFTLVEFALGGGDPVVPPTPPEPAAYAPPLPVLPFEGGRPVEGTPLEGHPSWAEARAAVGPDPADVDPGAAFVALRYYPPRREEVAGGGVVAAERTAIYSRYARPGGEPDLETRYEHRRVSVAGVEAPTGAWTWGTREFAASAVGACANESVALWDGVRHVLALDLLRSFTRFELDLRASPEPACERGTLYVLGDTHPPGALFGDVEQVHMESRTGYLEYADFLAD